MRCGFAILVRCVCFLIQNETVPLSLCKAAGLSPEMAVLVLRALCKYVPSSSQFNAANSIRSESLNVNGYSVICSVTVLLTETCASRRVLPEKRHQDSAEMDADLVTTSLIRALHLFDFWVTWMVCSWQLLCRTIFVIEVCQLVPLRNTVYIILQQEACLSRTLMVP